MTKKFECSSGNVFADLNVQNPEEALAKAELARQIHSVIKKKRLTQSCAAKILGIDQPKVSALLSGKLSGFSLERLFRFLNKLGKDVAISVTSKPRNRKRGLVIVNADTSSWLTKESHAK